MPLAVVQMSGLPTKEAAPSLSTVALRTVSQTARVTAVEWEGSSKAPITCLLGVARAPAVVGPISPHLHRPT